MRNRLFLLLLIAFCLAALIPASASTAPVQSATQVHARNTIAPPVAVVISTILNLPSPCPTYCVTQPDEPRVPVVISGMSLPTPTCPYSCVDQRDEMAPNNVANASQTPAAGSVRADGMAATKRQTVPIA